MLPESTPPEAQASRQHQSIPYYLVYSETLHGFFPSEKERTPEPWSNFLFIYKIQEKQKKILKNISTMVIKQLINSYRK